MSDEQNNFGMGENIILWDPSANHHVWRKVWNGLIRSQQHVLSQSFESFDYFCELFLGNFFDF